MKTVKLTVTLEIDGVQFVGFPVTRRLNLDEVQFFDYEKPFDSLYTDLPAGELSNIQLLVMQAQQPVTLRLNNQSDAGLSLASNGIVIILDCIINSGSARAKINNDS